MTMRKSFLCICALGLCAALVWAADKEEPQDPFVKYVVRGSELLENVTYITDGEAFVDPKTVRVEIRYDEESTERDLLDVTFELKKSFRRIVLDTMPNGHSKRRLFVFADDTKHGRVKGDGWVRLSKRNDGTFEVSFNYFGKYTTGPFAGMHFKGSASGPAEANE
ncbi:MAG: hypothetical protein ACYS8X_06415 [Planctomycetota bacterium]|jgi:hypothetical protein